MKVAPRVRPARNALAAIGAIGVVAYGCIDRPVNDVKPTTQSGISVEVHNDAVDKVDLLLEVDNSNSMTVNQGNIMAQFAPLIQTLVSPPCVSAAHPAPHACGADADDTPQYPPVKSLHVGIVSSDLGTPGSNVPGCVPGGGHGDDGLLNPIHFGPGVQMHEPTPGTTYSAPPGFRPDSCTDPNQYPSFITFDSTMAAGHPEYTTQFVTDFRCNAGLYVNGCGLEQQLESINRAINPNEGGHDASDHMGNTDPNAGFLRDDALLAIVLLSDEEDGSTRPDAQDVFNATSSNWSAADLNLRMYMYQQPCGAQDPTYRLERYIDPTNPNAGWLALKPSHPERVVFAAITGVPLDTGAGGTIDWDHLLGTPSAMGPDDFCGRDTSGLGNLTSSEGPISMQQANPDPNCALRTVPACRREGSTYDPTHPPCATTEQYFAWPSRRIVEVARRFDQAHLCNGAPCNNGLVTSICSGDYASAMQQIVTKIQSRLPTGCLPRVLQKKTSADGTETVDCVVREFVPADAESACDPAAGRSDPVGAPSVQTIDDVTYHVCDLAQVPFTDAGPVDPSTSGWFYNAHPTASSCHQQIQFLNNAPPTGSITRLECVQAVTGADADGGA